MSRFKKVQFIGYAISTKPAFCATENSADAGNRKYYLGEAQNEQDIASRMRLLTTVAARAQAAFARSGDVLKIFVIPEFFFRGAYGAYNGKNMETLLKDALESLLAGSAPDINMAVWGSAMLAERPVDFNQEGMGNKHVLGDEYLHIYEACRDFRTLTGKETPSLRDILFYLDELEDPAVRAVEPDLDPLAAVMEQMLRGCDRSAPLTISNKCLIMLDGERCLTVQKQFKSCVDFVLNYYRDKARTARNADCYLQTFVNYPPIAPTATENKAHDQDQYSSFTWEGLKIGVEICLDHIRRRLGKLENSLDLQIITSCGAEVMSGGIAAKTGGYVFNCDGDYTLPDAQNGEDAHTQLYRVEKAGDPATGVAAALGERIAPAQTIPVQHEDVERLFPKGAGELHVYAPQDIAARR